MFINRSYTFLCLLLSTAHNVSDSQEIFSVDTLSVFILRQIVEVVKHNRLEHISSDVYCNIYEPPNRVHRSRHGGFNAIHLFMFNIICDLLL